MTGDSVFKRYLTFFWETGPLVLVCTSCIISYLMISVILSDRISLVTRQFMGAHRVVSSYAFIRGGRLSGSSVAHQWCADCGHVHLHMMMHRFFVEQWTGSIAHRKLWMQTQCGPNIAYCHGHRSLLKICQLTRTQNFIVRTSLMHTSKLLCIKPV